MRPFARPVLMGRRFTVLNLAALLVGALAGLAAVGLRYLINLVQNVAFTRQVGDATPREENEFIRTGLEETKWFWIVILVPVMGGLLIALIRYYWPSLKQHGVTEVMAAVTA